VIDRAEADEHSKGIVQLGQRSPLWQLHHCFELCLIQPTALSD
jgi:hypothetical protein